MAVPSTTKFSSPIQDESSVDMPIVVGHSLSLQSSPPTETPDLGDSLEEEVHQLADALSSRFEELTLIHGLTQRLASNMKLTEESNEVARTLLEELSRCISLQTLAIELFPSPVNHASNQWNSEVDATGAEAGQLLFELVGKPKSAAQLSALIRAVQSHSGHRSGDERGVYIANQLDLSDCDSVANVESQHVALVSVQSRGTNLGHIIAIRSADQPEFGTMEAEMMASTSTMLAVHLLNQRQYQEMQSMFQNMVGSLAIALDAKDAYTCGHSHRVANLAVRLAQRLGYSDADLAKIRMGGILHDIGKIGIDDSVLRKPGRLSKEEFEQIQKHPILGYDILKGVNQFADLLPAVRHHHESWDGNGYPDGLSGKAIPRDAQILAVADAFDAMTSDRPYRAGMSIERVAAEFKKGRGKQWAADVVDELLKLPELQP